MTAATVHDARHGPWPDAVLEARGLTKRYGESTVLDSVDLLIGAGEVRALLGENGAGKSTLIKILAGVVKPDAGTVSIDGHAVTITDARSSQEAGIATLHQELQVVPGLSVAENVLLGHREYQRAGVVQWSTLNDRATALLASVGQHINPRRDAAQLSPVEQTMVAIARALSRAARLVILDEPTASLTDTESEQLFTAVRRLSDQGVAVLYVSHRLAEVGALCDTYSVLRNGEKVAEGAMADTRFDALITAMAGRPFSAIFPPRSRVVGRGDSTTMARLRGVRGRRCRDVDLGVSAGEIVGIAGLAGAGRSELLRIVAGLQRSRGGTVEITGGAVAMVPQERKAEGVIPDSIERNINLSMFGRLARRGLVSSRRNLRHAHERADEIGVVRRSIDQDILTLSGGNQQKVVLARVLATGPSLLLLDEPTRGVDVGTKSDIYHLIRARTNEGVSALVVSSELSELIGWCDRIAVMHEGRLMTVVDASATDERELLAWCYGHAPAPSGAYR
jgi:ABC-type sugar transport system ATPase subunit